MLPCFCFRKVGFRRDIAMRISELNERLDVVASDKDKFGFLSLVANDEQVERPITTCVIDTSEVQGREADKEKLIKMVLDEDIERLKLHPISIVGIGKTTLAKLVYNHKQVKNHFDKRIWVCVSHPFDKTRIAKEILEFLGTSSGNLISLPNIVENIHQSIEGKKLLVVLDDVWNEDPKKWKQLEDCLKSSFFGSRVLVTTRNENVGRIMGCLESDIFRVGLLSENESWELFCMIAFSGRSSRERASLEEIGREVVKRCKGLPLAIRAIAGLLRFKNSRMEWKSVLDSELWDFEGVQRDIVGPLWLSYNDLPSPLKQCFLYCAIFPKDYMMKKDELIRHWVAQGYIKGTQSRDMEILGDEYFRSLVVRSLFQDVVVVDRSIVEVGETWCKMHDIVHDFAQLLAKKECLRIDVDEDGELVSLDDSVGTLLRHLQISFKLKIQCLDSFYDLKKLRSLIVSSSYPGFSSYTFQLNLNKIFNEFSSLRSLVLSWCGIVEVPSNINRLIHLRELDLSHNEGLIELPDTLWELYNLQILDLRGSEKIRSVKGIGKLTNLRHLGSCWSNLLWPKEMVAVSGLRSLDLINIDVDNEEAFSLKHLKNFNQLSGSFSIVWLKRADKDAEDAKQAQFQDKEHITHMFLFLDDKEMTGQWKEHDEELLEALNAPPNLEILSIHYFMALRTPNWLHSLSFVKTVFLDDWKICERLPPLGKLPCLEDLQFQGFERVVKASGEFLGMDEIMKSTTVPFFPNLKSLKFNNFNNWEEWNDVVLDGDEEMMVMPSLTHLGLYWCNKLKALPNFIVKKTSLEQDIIHCSNLNLPK